MVSLESREWIFLGHNNKWSETNLYQLPKWKDQFVTKRSNVAKKDGESGQTHTIK